MVDILVPIARKVPEFGVIPTSLSGQFQAGISTSTDLAAQLGGRAARPTQPILIYSADERVLTVIMPEGDMEAAQIEDMADHLIDRNADRQKRNGGRAFDFDTARQKADMARREDFDRLFRDALLERIERHKRNPVTDPPRVPRNYFV